MTDPRKPFSVPWTDSEIRLLYAHQQSDHYHPYTCNGGRHHTEHVHDHTVLLVPTMNGWICPEPVDHIAAGEDPNGEGTWVVGVS